LPPKRGARASVKFWPDKKLARCFSRFTRGAGKTTRQFLLDNFRVSRFAGKTSPCLLLSKGRVKEKKALEIFPRLF